MSKTSVSSIIDDWPSLSNFARDARVSYGAAKQMRRRASVPVCYWSALIDSQRGKEIGLSAELLARAHAPADREVAA